MEQEGIYRTQKEASLHFRARGLKKRDPQLRRLNFSTKESKTFLAQAVKKFFSPQARTKKKPTAFFLVRA